MPRKNTKASKSCKTQIGAKAAAKAAAAKADALLLTVKLPPAAPVTAAVPATINTIGTASASVSGTEPVTVAAPAPEAVAMEANDAVAVVSSAPEAVAMEANEANDAASVSSAGSPWSTLNLYKVDLGGNHESVRALNAIGDAVGQLAKALKETQKKRARERASAAKKAAHSEKMAAKKAAREAKWAKAKEAKKAAHRQTMADKKVAREYEKAVKAQAVDAAQSAMDCLRKFVDVICNTETQQPWDCLELENLLDTLLSEPLGRNIATACAQALKDLRPNKTICAAVTTANRAYTAVSKLPTCRAKMPEVVHTAVEKIKAYQKAEAAKKAALQAAAAAAAEAEAEAEAAAMARATKLAMEDAAKIAEGHDAHNGAPLEAPPL